MNPINPNDPMSPETALDVFRQMAERYTATGADHAIIQKAYLVLSAAIPRPPAPNPPSSAQPPADA